MNPYYLTKEWKDLRNRVVKRDAGVCFYCGEPGRQADHVVPRNFGGGDNIHNLVCCCARCNKLLRASFFVSKQEKRRWVQSQLRGTRYIPIANKKRNLVNGMKPWECKTANKMWPNPEERLQSADAKLQKWVNSQGPDPP